MRADVTVIGAGPAGLAAAIAAKEAGAGRVLILERAQEPGGILNQCIHNGFGLHRFGEELTGPEYAGRFSDRLEGIECRYDTMVLALEGRTVTAVNPKDGLFTVESGAVVLAMGCRERTRGAIGVPGDRPSGVFTAGAAQRYMNIEGYRVGERAVILGSGDIGLIMARRMTLEGAKVLACVELMPYSSGLNRNIVQCLQDYDIPLYLSHTIVRIIGKTRLEAVIVARVDENRRPIPGTEFRIDCDTLLLSVGLIPENELSRGAGLEIDPHTNGPVVYDDMETSEPGVFACGNVVQVHDLVDFVSDEGERAGRAAAAYAERHPDGGAVETVPGEGIGYVVPQRIRRDGGENDVTLFFRVRTPCPKGELVVRDGEREIVRKKRLHMTPGEMEKLPIDREAVRNAQRLTVSLERAQEGTR